MLVQLFIPCFMDQLYPHTALNTLKVLERAGCTVLYNPAQTCCGQPAFNAGFIADAKAVCKKFITENIAADYIVTPSASCCGFVKNNFKTVFEGNSDALEASEKLGKKVYELSYFLIHILKITHWESSFKGNITYHDSCAALRECNIKTEPRLLLNMLQHVTLVEMEYTTVCCGFGGSFAVKFADISVAMAEQKVDAALLTETEYIVSTDTSCLMHLEGYIIKNNKQIKVLHLADILAS